MPKDEVGEGRAKGDPEAIAAFADAMLKLTAVYSQNQPISTFDVFLGVLTYSKFMMHNIAADLAKGGFPEQKLYRLADTEFRQAMKDLNRSLKPYPLGQIPSVEPSV